MRRENTWPVETPYGPGAEAIWAALHARFGLDFAASLDPAQPAGSWRRFLYFSAGWFFGTCPRTFGTRFRDWAVAVRDDPPPELAAQPLDPWLDQVVLPLVVQSFGGGRPGPELAGLDGAVTCHWRTLPLLYAREDDRVVALLEEIAQDLLDRQVARAVLGVFDDFGHGVVSFEVRLWFLVWRMGGKAKRDRGTRVAYFGYRNDIARTQGWAPGHAPEPSGVTFGWTRLGWRPEGHARAAKASTCLVVPKTMRMLSGVMGVLGWAGRKVSRGGLTPTTVMPWRARRAHSPRVLPMASWGARILAMAKPLSSSMKSIMRPETRWATRSPIAASG
jgi:hypothetical protein